MSPYKMGWIIVSFDLPTLTKEDRKAAADFRKELLKDGFSMLNYSVYSRPCPEATRMKKHVERLKTYTPETGNIYIFFITEKQWENALVVVGKEYKKSHGVREAPEMEQLTFW